MTEQSIRQWRKETLIGIPATNGLLLAHTRPDLAMHPDHGKYRITQQKLTLESGSSVLAAS